MRLALDIHHLMARQLDGNCRNSCRRVLGSLLVSTRVRPSSSLVNQSRTRARPHPCQHPGRWRRSGFQCIGQNRLTAKPPLFNSPSPGAGTHPARNLGPAQGSRHDQARAQSRQLPLAGLRKRSNNASPATQVEDGITEEFQTLIVAPGETAVRQCQEHQLLVLEGMTEPTLETGKRLAHWARFEFFVEVGNQIEIFDQGSRFSYLR